MIEDIPAEMVMAAIDAALARITSGTYGTCVACGGRIPQARLEVRPQTARRVGCQIREEQRV